jgi:hypothetical protein
MRGVLGGGTGLGEGGDEVFGALEGGLDEE